MGRVLAIAMIVVLVLSFTGCTKSDEYEVIERTENQVPNFQGAGTHTEVNLVLVSDRVAAWRSDTSPIGTDNPFW